MTQIKHVLLFVVLLCSLTVSAEDFVKNGIYYNITQELEVDGGYEYEVEVTFCGDYYNSFSNEYIGDIVIPSSTLLGNFNIGCDVTGIGESSFRFCNGLTSVTIPESITGIGNYAFYNCNSLASVTIAENSRLESIGNEAFRACSSLTSITLPASVTSIGDRAFCDCLNLTSITCKAMTPPTIGSSNTFSEVNKSIPVYVPAGSIESYRTASYWSGFTNFQPIVNPPCGDNLTWTLSDTGELTIEGTGAMFDFVEKTAPWYKHWKEIKTVVLREGVTSIGDFAFYNCGYLTSINIPEGVTSIGDFAFDNCVYLTSVNIPEGVTSIGDAAFYYCRHLTTITLPEGVTSIGGSAFSQCGLTSISLPEGLTGIGSFAFNECYDLRYVTIPASLESIGIKAFYDCLSLTEVYISCIDGWCNIDFGDYASNPLWDYGELYLNGKLVEKLTIPEDVTSIGDYAFLGCGSLTSITCKATTPPAIGGTQTFDGVDKSIPVYVPAGSVEAYKAAEYWSEFTNIRPITNEYTLAVSSAGYATLYLDYAVEIPDDVKVYIATSVEGDRLMMTRVTGVLPAETGVIVRAEAGEYTFAESGDTPANVGGNLLSGTAADTYIAAESGYKYYVLAKKDGVVAMYHPQLNANGKFLNNANKAYLRLESDDLGIFDDETNTEEEGGQLSNRLRFDFGGTTEIEKTIDHGQQTTVIYDLQGRRVEKPTKPGIYIVDGQKVVF